MTMQEKINNYLEENNMSVRCWEDNPYGIEEFETEILWGDWKHDHARFKYLMREFAESIDMEFDYIEWTIEEDGSDCYSTGYRFRFVEKQDPITDMEYILELLVG